jgi:uncharacterized protein (TIGR02145 family)
VHQGELKQSLLKNESMKTRFFFLALLLMISSALFAQVGINAGNDAPDPSAMLDVKSTTKGFLPPRMTISEMNSIIAPAQGLIVYNITLNSLYWFNGSAWMRISEPFSETDPVFTAHPSFGITTGSIGNWNTAYTNRITAVAGASPLDLSVSNNQLNGSVSMANSITNGYLTSADWNTFNNKQGPLAFGTLSSSQMTVTGGTGAVIGAGAGLTITKGDIYSSDMTITMGHNAVLEIIGTTLFVNKANLTVSGSPVLTITGGSNAVLGTGTSIQVKQAGTSQSGYLSSSDWNSFNNKVNSQWISNGLKLYYNSGNVGIGASNPQNKLDIAGNVVIGATYSGSGTAAANGLLVEGMVGIGTSATASSASLEVTGTNTGVLLPRMTTAQRNLIASPAEGLTVYNTDEKELNVYNGTEWNSMTLSMPFMCGLNIRIHHLISGGVAPVNKTVAYGTVSGIAGETSKCWITSNLGADRQATAVNDATEPSAGWYWQFNHKQGYKHDGTTLTPAWTIFSIYATTNWTTANDPCAIELGTGWRIPTRTEWTNVDAPAGGNWTNWNGPWNSGLKMHGAGYLLVDGSLHDRGSSGYYWSSALETAYYTSSYCLHMNSGNSEIYYYNNAEGHSVRCLNDASTAFMFPVVTTTSVTGITQTAATSGGNVTFDGGGAVTGRGVCWSTTVNPTISNSKTTDGSGTGTFTSSLTGLTKGTLYYVRAYATNSIGTAYGAELSFTTLPCGDPLPKIHLVTGGVAPVNKAVIYGTVTNIPGETLKCWITSNLGADHQATAVTDATEPSAGWYWQFNRKQGYKHDGTNRTPNTAWITSISEDLNWTTANDPCNIELGTTWHLPTYTEWYNVDNTGGWTTLTDPWGSGLKLHAAGSIYYSNGSMVNRGSSGYYWSNTKYDATNGWLLGFGSGYSMTGINAKAYGYSARCVRDN